MFQCLSSFIEIYGKTPLEKFLPFIIEGFSDSNKEVQNIALNCLQSLFYCTKPKLSYKVSDINKILKSDDDLEIIKVLLFAYNYNLKSEKLSSVIKKCLKHKKISVQFCGGILLRDAYNNIHSQLLDFESSAKLAHKQNNNALKYFNNEIKVVVDWIEEDMNKLKRKLSHK